MGTTARQRAATLGYATAHVTCAACSIDFAVPERFESVRLVDGLTFYCPVGHPNYYPAGKTDAQVARERAALYERLLANRDEDLRAERASHAATKGLLTKAKKRTAGGACPCCNRTFVNVARHMAGQHPDYAAT